MSDMARDTVEYRDAEWRAVNGHLMAGREVRFGGGAWRTEGWSATHSTNCQCEDDGATLEDW